MSISYLVMIENRGLTNELRQVLKDARIVAAPMPLTPEIELYLLNEDYPRRAATDEERRLLMDEPPFWAFSWSSGQVLARWIMDHRDVVCGKRVLDFGAGSGIAAVAAALCGADDVVALDCDPLALFAIRANAELNNVEIVTVRDLKSRAGRFDVIFAADVLYDRGNLSLLDVFRDIADLTIVADSRFKELTGPFSKIGSGVAVTYPDLGEYDEFRNVDIFSCPRIC